MNETIPDKEAYQTNRRRMCWAALGMMIACTAVTISDPTRMAEADSILMAQYLALSGMVGAYFAHSKNVAKSLSAVQQVSKLLFLNVETIYVSLMRKNIN